MELSWFIFPAFLRVVPAQLSAHLSAVAQHDFDAAERLNCLGDITYQWHVCRGESWGMRNLSMWTKCWRPGVIREGWCGRLEERTSLMAAGIWQRRSLGCERNLRETILGYFYLDSIQAARSHGLWSGVRAGLQVTAASVSCSWWVFLK